MLVAVVAVALTVPLAGGRLRRLAEVEFRAGWSLAVALALQVLVISVLPGTGSGWQAPLHVASYVVGAWFFVANRRVPGLWLMGAGALLNFAAITANAGVMPAAPEALATSGRAVEHAGFINSAAVANARLAFLGDVFATPASWPLGNVFSLGDLLLVLGAAIVLHRLSGSTLLPPALRQFARLRAHPGFGRLWLAQGLSNVGDFMYALAVSTMVVRADGGAKQIALLLALQMGSTTLSALFGGVLVDRVRRGPLMVAADVARALAVGSLLVVAGPTLAHLCAVAVCLGLFAGLFQPAFFASLPNVVGRADLVLANSLVSATYHVAIMLSPALAGLLVAQLGSETVFAVNAASFAISAVLILGVRGVSQRPAHRAEPARVALVEGLRFTFTDRTTTALFVVGGTVMLAAAVKMPLEPVFLLNVLDAGASGLGLAESAWGLGMVFAALAAPRLVARFGRERLIAVSLVAVAAVLAVGSQAASLAPILFLWVVGGGGNAFGTISWDSLLQERVPDALRGRVLAAFDALLHLGVLCGAALSTVLVTVLDVRQTYLVAAAIFLAAGVLTRVLLGTRGAPATTAREAAAREDVVVDAMAAPA